MKQKLIAVAVAGALAAPAVALAQSSTVQIYGTFNAEYGFVSAGDPAPGLLSNNNYDGFDSGASNIGIKAMEKLGGGLSVWVQCESDVRFLAGSTATSGTICGRNSAIGLKGSYGNVFVGTWDSPGKLAVGKTRMLADTGFLGVTHMTFDDFSNRNVGSMNYHSPNFGGFDFKIQTTTTNGANGTQGAGNKGRLTSAAGVYAGGPLTVAVGYTAGDDNRASAGGDGAKDTNLTLGATYKFGPAKIGFTWYDETFKGVTGSGDDIDGSAWNLAGQFDLGSGNSILAGYTKRDKFEGNLGGTPITGSTGAKEYQISFIHKLSKRTTTAVGWASLKNDGDSDFYTVGNRVESGTQKLGAKSSVITVQLKHAF